MAWSLLLAESVHVRSTSTLKGLPLPLCACGQEGRHRDNGLRQICLVRHQRLLLIPAAHG